MAVSYTHLDVYKRQAVLTSSFALLAFSKYWRAQIAPIIDPYCIIRFNYWFLQSFTSPDFRKYRRAQTTPFYTYIAENIHLFWFCNLFFCVKKDYSNYLLQF